MRKPLVILTSAAIVGGGAYAAVAQAATRSVSVGDDWYVSSKYDGKLAKVTIKRGSRVRFNFDKASVPHNVSGNSRIFLRSMEPTRLREKGDEPITTKALKRGTYRLYCSVHGSERSGQRITITVK